MADNRSWKQEDCETTECEKDVDKIVRKLKSSDYYDALNTIRYELGISSDANFSEIEALLIFATNKRFGHQYKADVALMGMGLLRGFSRPRERSECENERDQYSARREDFLKHTNYIAVQKGSCNSYEEAKSTTRDSKKGTTELDTIRGNIDKYATNYIKGIVSSLYSLKNIDAILSETKADFKNRAKEIGCAPIVWGEAPYIPDELLPKLCYFVEEPDEPEKVEPSIETVDDSERGQTPTSPTTEQRDGGKPKQAEENQPPKRPHPAKHEKNSWKIVAIVASVLIAAVVVMFLLFGKFHFTGSYTDHGSPNESHTDNGGLIGGGSTDDGGRISVEQSDPKNAERRIEFDFSYWGPFSGENNK